MKTAAIGLLCSAALARLARWRPPQEAETEAAKAQAAALEVEATERQAEVEAAKQQIEQFKEKVMQRAIKRMQQVWGPFSPSPIRALEPVQRQFAPQLRRNKLAAEHKLFVL